MRPYKLYTYLLLVILLGSCRGLENNFNIELEAEEHELVVECYLEAGRPYQLLLTETKNFSEVVNVCPFVRNAIVTITHNGVVDTLREAEFTGGGCSTIVPYFNEDSTRFFNYGSTTICPSDFSAPFILEVWDTANDRYVVASTQFLPSVPIQSFGYTFEADSFAYATIDCKDNLSEYNHYRIMIHKNALSKKAEGGLFRKVMTNPEIDETMYDRDLFTNGVISATTNAVFRPRDTIIGTIYHIDETYHNFLISMKAAQDANNIPFVEPTPILSNIQGGAGIFTFLSYDRDTLYLP